ncbi:MAG: putative Ig domain-containing protein [Candidatus Poseidoniaceae archaeon]|nr:putative Ig domain-containing protein [Candidatus Poseidoniaceae archaeon]
MGQGNTTSLALPTSVSILPSSRSVVQIAVGASHACALLDNNSLMCWGDNGYSQLGDGTTTDRVSGVYVELGTRTISYVGTGWLGTCVAYHEGGASCWGRNDNGMVGDGTTTRRSTPVNVTGLGANTTFTSLHPMFGETCGIAANGSLLCWGDNNGIQAAHIYTPGIVDVGTGVSTVSVALDTDTACALLSTGEIQCWGWNGNDGDFGLNSTSSSATPVRGVTNETHRTINGGWNIVGALPQGLQFSPANGTIWGTPVLVQPQWTNYSVKVFNSAGTSTYTFSVRVIDTLPNVTYAPPNLTLTNNTVSSDLPLIPTVSGSGDIMSWAINASLPSGVSFGTNNGTIYGTPTELWTQTSYKIWANNTGGTVEGYLNLTVVDEIPTSINYPVINLNLTNNTASPDLPMSPQITGPGAILSWEISDDLPQGLTFDSNTGEISGIPTELWPTTNYTVWANNSGGSVEIEFNITVVDQLPTDFSYSPENLTLSNNTASPYLPLAPTLTGSGEILTWSINETLPNGLNFGNNNGTIWGIPTVLQLTPMPYTIWANNTGGSISATINITILEVEPTLEYNPDDYNFTRGVIIGDIVPNYTPIDLIDTWEISPDVPLGLSFNNGVISGTPTVNSTKTEYTVWANNSGGAISATFNITIVEPTGSFAYVPPSINMTRGQGISPINPNYNGGAIESWSIYPDLPAGLIFDNGTITGTPTVNSTEVNYTVFANNSGGSVTAIISITINEPVASIHYAPNERNETRTISMTPWFPHVTGGEVETWEIYPDLPLGLNFVDGVISGVATVNSTTTNYTVWANNSGGSASTNIYLTVVEPVVELSYNNYELILIRNVTMSPLTPQLTGGDAETWEIYPDLPNGINFTDGMIWGTPEINSTRMMYTVWANNTGGSTNISLNITILEPSANIVYDPVNLILTRGQTMDSATPEVDGGSIENWSIHPELPNGLNFDNGTISGTPTVNMTTTNFLIYGNNSGGSSVVGISITILEPAPTITYQADYLILTRGEEMPSALHAIFGGGAVASFNVEPELPDGLNFTNGTIFGIPTVNSSLVQYNITAINNGGSDFFLLNITILEPVAILDVETNYFELTRNETEMNLTFNNTGGMVATWEVYPELPNGLIFGNGTITGVPTVNSSLETYEIFANNTGGSASILINIKILEPAANISYRTTQFTLINGQDALFIAPDILGGNPDTWEFEPELPEGITFSNGVFSGVPAENLSTTTYTVWANNSGGSSVATIELTINQPFYVVRYPVTILVLNASEDMPVLAPVYYFDETSDPVWAVSPALPDGLTFTNGNISGTPTTPQPLTQYNVTVVGDMVPFTIVLMIEIMGDEVNMTIPDNRNQTALEQGPPETIFPEPEEENIAFWLCPLILIILLWLTAMLYNARKTENEVEMVEGPESEQK